MAGVRVFGVQRVEGPSAGLEQLGAVAQHLVGGEQLVELLDGGIHRFQLANLPRQELHPLLAVSLVSRLAFELRDEAPVPAAASLHPLDALDVTAPCVHDLALRVAAQQGLVGMLAVDVDEALREAAQHLDRDRPAVDVRSRAAVLRDGAPQEALAGGFVELVFLQPGTGRGVGFRCEQGSHFRPGCSGSQQCLAGALAEGEVQRIDENRLAGARLSGEDGQPGTELEIEAIDDRKVAQVQMGQHCSAPERGCSGRRSAFRACAPSEAWLEAWRSSRVPADGSDARKRISGGLGSGRPGRAPWSSDRRR